MMADNVKALVRQYEEEIISLRRYFHTYPEIGGEEIATQQKIVQELQNIGLDPRQAAGTGVIAEIQGALPGRTVAIRADIDALPIQDECGHTYQSKHSGKCHACGHDGHIAMLIGAAKVFFQMKDHLPGKVRLLFQPSEESYPGGALALIAAGALDGVAAIIGGHLWQPLKAGQLGISYGRLMAATDQFSIVVKGRGGHGAMPHQTIDSLLVGAQLVVALNTIISRNIDPLEQAVLSVGVFQAGEVYNIIPDTAIIKGTVRTFDRIVYNTIFARVEQITKGICEAAGATYQLDNLPGFPPVVNNPSIAAVLASAGKEVLGEENVLTIGPVMGGEDFSYYQQKIPGAFLFIGAGNVGKGIVHAHHHPKFDIDEDVLAVGVETMVRAVMTLMVS